MSWREKNTDLSKMREIFRYFSPLRKYFFLTGLAIVLTTLFSLPVPYLNQRLIDDVIIGKDYQMLYYVIIVWLVLLLVRPLVSAMKRYNLDLFEMKFDLGVKADIFAKTMHLPVEFFSQNQLGYIQSRIDGDVGALHTITAGRILGIFNNLVNLLFGLFMMCTIHRGLTFLTLIIVPFTLLNSYVFAEKMKEMNKKVSESWATQRGSMFESIFGIDTVKNFLLERLKILEFRKIYAQSIEMTMKRTVLELVSGFIGMVISGLSPLMIWGYGAVLTIKGQITLGELTAFVGYSGFVIGPAIELASLKLNFQGAMAAWERIKEILTLDDEKILAKDKPVLAIQKGLIEFQNVSFAFGEGAQIIRDVSFTINPGEKVAVVGSNGSGKSTLIRLLLQSYYNYDGQIRIDGQELKAHDLYSVRRQIAFVSQDVFLFKGTILENIIMGDEAITEEEIIQVMKKIRLEEYVKTLPDGLNTRVEERGANLSGGQKQLISIARALVKRETKVIIFDEATSSLDPALEEYLCKNIELLCAGRTFINVAHRPTFLNFVDKVIALENGQVVYAGNRAEFGLKIPRE